MTKYFYNITMNLVAFLFVDVFFQIYVGSLVVLENISNWKTQIKFGESDFWKVINYKESILK